MQCLHYYLHLMIFICKYRYKWNLLNLIRWHTVINSFTHFNQVKALVYTKALLLNDIPEWFCFALKRQWWRTLACLSPESHPCLTNKKKERVRQWQTDRGLPIGTVCEKHLNTVFMMTGDYVTTADISSWNWATRRRSWNIHPMPEETQQLHK